VLLLAAGDVIRGRYLTLIGWLAILLTICGCFLTPLRSVKDFAVRRYFNRANIWILLAALSSVGYWLLNKVASELVEPGPGTAARYGYMFFLVGTGAYCLFLRLYGKAEQNSDHVGWSLPVPAAFLHFGAYWLVLWAYQLSEHVSYIVAFRQFSIVMSVVLAFVIYKERGRVMRLIGTTLLTTGLVLIATWGK